MPPDDPSGSHRTPGATDAAVDASARATALTGMLCAASMIAHQVGAKATRDAFYLSQFDVTTLPRMVIGSAILSMIFVVATTKIMPRVGPRRLVPAAFLTSGAIQLAVWGLAQSEPRAAAVVIYLHVAAFGAILISAFWSLVNECFDPRRARRYIGRITGASTVGGLIGGLVAAGVGSALSVQVMLPVLAGFHVLCALISIRLRPALGAGLHPADDEGSESELRGFKLLRVSGYLRSLAVLVFLLTAAAALLDYVFKAEAAARFTDGETLIRFFAAFYAALGLLTVVVQAGLGRVALQKLGLSRTVGALPLAAGFGVATALAVPGLVAAGIARGAESVLRNSLYRSGYEVLFNPITPTQKRSVKTVIDVGFDRLGDAVGGALVTLLLLAGAAAARGWILGVAIALFLAALILIPLLGRGFELALARSMKLQARRLDLMDAADDTGNVTIMQSLTGLELSDVLSPEFRERLRMQRDAKTALDAGATPESESDAPPGAAPPPRVAPPSDPVVAAVASLRSRDPDAIRTVIASSHAPAPDLVPHLIPLLAWNEVAPEVMRALRRAAPRVTGQLVDALIDPDEEFAIRRRLPRVLSYCPTPRAVDGLKLALRDRRFEVRYQAGHALNRIHDLNPEIRFADTEIYDAVLREVSVDKRVWESYRIIDALDRDEESEFLDDAIRNRANRSLEHVFTLLALVLPKEPLKISFRGLHASDPTLRGTALEYLELILPKRIRKSLWPFLEAGRADHDPERNREQVIQDLMRSSDSIRIDLNRLRGTDGKDS